MIFHDTLLSSEEFAIHITGCARNERESQQKIFAAFFRPAMELCEYYTNTKKEALEILSKSFLKIFRKISIYSPTCAFEMSSFQNWLHEIITDEAIDHYCRNSKRHPLHELGNRTFLNSDIIKNKLAHLVARDKSMT